MGRRVPGLREFPRIRRHDVSGGGTMRRHAMTITGVLIALLVILGMLGKR
jgi:hypothetical protein